MTTASRQKMLKRIPTEIAPNLHPAVSKDWSDVHAKFESMGRWHDLLQIAEALSSDSQAYDDLSMRWQAALARSLVFTGAYEQARTLLNRLEKQLKSCGKPQDEAQIVFFLALAALERSQHNWPLSLELAKKAKTIAINNDNLHLEMDAAFGEAVTLSENGNIFAAIEIFQSIRSNLRNVSSYRRGLATLNEAWCLWDIGQVDHIKQTVELIPREYRAKIEVYIAALETQDFRLRHWVVHGFGSDVPISPVDLENIILILAEWQSLAPQSEKAQSIQNTWLWNEILIHEKKSSGGRLIKFQCCRLLLSESGFFSWPEPHLKLNALAESELGFASILSLVKIDRVRAANLYRKTLDLLLSENRICTPLIPSWKDLQIPTNAWAQRLAKIIVGDSAKCLSTKSYKAKKLILKSTILSAVDGSYSIELDGHPTSLKLIKILAGRAGRVVSKAQIHRQIEGTPYRPYLNDPRLYKLIGRLRQKIEKILHVCPWTFQRDNCVVLEIDLEIHENNTD